MRKYLLGFAFIALFAASCKKDRNMEKAVVRDTGDIAFGGCGFILQLESNGTFLRPSYLDSKYRHEGYKVKVKYSTRDEFFFCSGAFPDTSRSYIEINIDDIKTNND